MTGTLLSAESIFSRWSKVTISQYILCSLHLPLIHVYAVAQCRESVETDSHRQDNLEGRNRQLLAEQTETIHKRLYEEIVVLEPEQDAEVQDDSPKRNPPTLSVFVFVFVFVDFTHPQSRKVCRECRHEQQPEEPPVPEAIEEQACKNYQSVLQVLVLSANKPIYKEYYWKE